MTLYLSHFFYTLNGGFMIIYIDGLLFLNFYLDFLLLLTVVVILKKNVKIFRIVLGAFIGSLTILVLFFKIGSLELFFIKIYLSFIMCIVCFGYKSLRGFFIDIGCFYMVSILLGGFLFFFNINFSYAHNGIIFFNKGFSISILFLIIISPIILYLYVRQIKLFKQRMIYSFKTNIYIGNKVLNLNGYLDSGNTLTYKNTLVIFQKLLHVYKLHLHRAE